MKRLIIAASIAACILPAIAQQTLVVTSPDSDDVWKALSTETIEWTYSGETPDSFDIVWREVGGYLRYHIAYVDSDAREYDWLVATPCTHLITQPTLAVVYVIAMGVGDGDQSDTFTIVPSWW